MQYTTQDNSTPRLYDSRVSNVTMSRTREQCVATYIWLGEDSMDIRSLRRVLPSRPKDLSEIPTTSCDGTHLTAPCEVVSAFVLQPVSIYPHPNSPERDVLVLCQAVWVQTPPAGNLGLFNSLPANTRSACEHVMVEANAHSPTFVILQEYSIRDAETNQPLGKGGRLEGGQSTPFIEGAFKDMPSHVLSEVASSNRQQSTLHWHAV